MGADSGGVLRATRALLLNGIHWELTRERHLFIKSTRLLPTS